MAENAGQSSNRFFRDAAIPAGELLLTILPLIVLTIAELATGQGFLHILRSPEWSFGASVLFGLAIFKIVVGAVKYGSNSWQAIALIVAAVIAAGQVPSLVIFALRLATAEPPTMLVIAQDLLFLASCVTFFILATFSHDFLFDADRRLLRLRERKLETTENVDQPISAEKHDTNQSASNLAKWPRSQFPELD